MTARTTTFDSCFGPVTVVWERIASRMAVRRIFLSRPGLKASRSAAVAFPGTSEATCPPVRRLVRDLERLLAGSPVTIDLETATLDRCSAFRQKVLRAEHAVPRGKVTTYARLAASIGSPGAARAVGSALANNPFPLIIPCHRAVRSDGSLGGYQGGASMKRALLELEGIGFTPGGKVLPGFIRS